MTDNKTLTDILKEATLNRFFKHGPSYYQITDLWMNGTGHIKIDARVYSELGVFKGLTAIMPIIDQYSLIEEKDLPFDLLSRH